MTNIFLFRHGECFNSDCDSEVLSPKGIRQAEQAGIIVADKIIERYLFLRGKGDNDFDEIDGVLAVSSERPRAQQFLEKILSVADEKFNAGPLGFYGDKIKIISPLIYSNSDPESVEKIQQIIKQCSPLTGIHLVVGHSFVPALVAESYVKKEKFNYEGKDFSLPMGAGYWVNTTERRVEKL